MATLTTASPSSLVGPKGACSKWEHFWPTRINFNNSFPISFPFYRTNCYKQAKITKIYYSIVLEVRSLNWVSWGQNQGVSQAAFLLEDNLFPCLFQLLEVTCIPWLVAPSFIFKCSSIESSKTAHLFSFLIYYPAHPDNPTQSLLSRSLTLMISAKSLCHGR